MALIISQQTICSLHPTHLIINLTEIHIHHFLVGWRERTWDLGLILLCLAHPLVLFFLTQMGSTG